MIIGFTRYLGDQGFLVSTSQVLDAVKSAMILGVESKPDLKNGLRAALCQSREQFAGFELLFEDYFQARPRAPSFEPPPARALGETNLGLGVNRDKKTETEKDPQNPASEIEVLGRVGFHYLDPEQAAAMAQEVSSLLKPLAQKISRRKTPGRSRLLYWQATLRKGLRSGGELVDLKYRRPRKKPRRLVILADISGSMDLAAPFLFHFLKGLAVAWRQVEVYVFATRLTLVTKRFFDLPVDQLMARLARLAPDLAGGTLIGRNLARLLSRTTGSPLTNSVALIISDGWDRGEPEELARQMARLKARCQRVFWLNPLLESPRYKPINQGMAAALPHVDHFLACHNLNALKKTARLLEIALK
ncbi:vWA domain-containing protein [Dethiosulfatarculus sandiegensis]|uniref:VWFA domain-containing protein n=1 Tax=Dethiosulfatarculus sandiegensis TaxID=1429043 RepID=A0A0D2HPE6_9BACT|nr:VWA domain-containing protein [Dethiosulfatarculus sandiegensis]KIX12378.1 hypothetical protein X474_19450 [Dethiosulfatarculus sandiegensis]